MISFLGVYPKKIIGKIYPKEVIGQMYRGVDFNIVFKCQTMETT